MIRQKEILKGYDPVLMRRLLAYVKPYLLSVVLALAALLLATTGEMSLPVLIQKAVDEHILPRSRKVDPAGAGAEILARIEVEGRSEAQRDDHWICDLLFVPASRLIDLTTSERAGLIGRGALSEEDYLVIEIDSSSRSIMDRYPALFIVGESEGSPGRSSPIRAAIRAKDLQQLSRDEVKVLRQRHYRGLTLLAIQFLGILACILIASFGQIYLLTYIAQMVMRDIRTELFGHTIRLSLKYLEANPVGRLVTRITNDVETINELFSTVITSFLKDISLMVGVFITLFILNTRLALLSLLSLPPVVVAIVGYTGAGKTTIASLLARLWDIQGGRILLDGVNIRNLPTDVLRGQVQSVLQEVVVFAGTVEENIRLGSDISFEQIQRAARLVEEGDHATLFRDRGIYYNLYQMQFLEEEKT